MTTVTPYHQPSDHIANGIIPTAKQAWHDLFVWKQPVIVQNSVGETNCEWIAPDSIKNPIDLLALLLSRDWLFFIVDFLAWTVDAFDFHALTIQTTKLDQYYHTSSTTITTATTLSLLLRSLGAATFGILGDKIGLKWPMIINLFILGLILGLIQVATIYCRTLAKFIAVRAIFGIFMGGIYGNAMAMALENCPIPARGLVSGILQQGYSFGYVLAAYANLGVGKASEAFKTVLWITAASCFAVGFMRIFLSESDQFLVFKDPQQNNPISKAFWRDIKQLLVTHYKMCLYCIFLMAWFNFYSHTSQDSYTTFMKVDKSLDNAAASRASIWMNVGGCIGGTLIGYVSQFFGRRRTIIVSALASACMIPGWILPHSEAALSATGFLMQFFVQGAWGCVPIHLNELTPAAYRSSFAGITYQLGNMISSPSTQIVNAIAEHQCRRHATSHLSPSPCIPVYGPVMGIAIAIVAVNIIATVAVGPERRGRIFESEDLSWTTQVNAKSNELAVRGEV